MQGLNIMGFCKEYNAATAQRQGETVPVELTIFEVSPPRGTNRTDNIHLLGILCNRSDMSSAILLQVQDRRGTIPLQAH